MIHEILKELVMAQNALMPELKALKADLDEPIKRLGRLRWIVLVLGLP